VLLGVFGVDLKFWKFKEGIRFIIEILLLVDLDHSEFSGQDFDVRK
jgi:hypothetical protein